MEQAVNQFSEGLVTDYNPLLVSNNILTDSLNGTFVTMNGNEKMLQNDMGNAKVEEVHLDNGYVPVGVKEHGGILYIASHNPITGKSQLGSFPSPERNFDGQELDGNDDGIQFEEFEEKKPITKFITKQQLFGGKVIHPGNKFVIYYENEIKNVSNYDNVKKNVDGEVEKIISPKNNIKTYKVMVQDSGNNLIDITDQLKRFDIYNEDEITYSENNSLNFNTGYFIPKYEKEKDKDNNFFKNHYNIYKNKWSGSMFLVEEYNVIDRINVNVITSTDKTDSNTLYVQFNITYYYNCPDGFFTTNASSYSRIPLMLNSQMNENSFEVKSADNNSIKSFLNFKGHTSYTYPSYDYETNLYTYTNSIKYTINKTTSENDFSFQFDDEYITVQSSGTKFQGTDENSLYQSIYGNYNFSAIEGSEINLEINKDVLNYKITPKMTYSEAINSLGVSGTINLDKIGSNDIDLDVWKYKKNCLDVGLTTYFDDTNTFDKIEIVCIDIADAEIVNNDESIKTIKGKVVDNPENFSEKYKKTITLENLRTIKYNPSSDGLEENKIYYCYIYCKYIYHNNETGEDENKTELINTRWLITNNIYQDLYNEIEDFGADESLKAIQSRNEVKIKRKNSDEDSFNHGEINDNLKEYLFDKTLDQNDSTITIGNTKYKEYNEPIFKYKKETLVQYKIPNASYNVEFEYDTENIPKSLGVLINEINIEPIEIIDEVNPKYSENRITFKNDVLPFYLNVTDDSNEEQEIKIQCSEYYKNIREQIKQFFESNDILCFVTIEGNKNRIVYFQASDTSFSELEYAYNKSQYIHLKEFDNPSEEILGKLDSFPTDKINNNKILIYLDDNSYHNIINLNSDTRLRGIVLLGYIYNKKLYISNCAFDTLGDGDDKAKELLSIFVEGEYSIDDVINDYYIKNKEEENKEFKFKYGHSNNLKLLPYSRKFSISATININQIEDKVINDKDFIKFKNTSSNEIIEINNNILSKLSDNLKSKMSNENFIQNNDFSVFVNTFIENNTEIEYVKDIKSTDFSEEAYYLESSIMREDKNPPFKYIKNKLVPYSYEISHFILTKLYRGVYSKPDPRYSLDEGWILKGELDSSFYDYVLDFNKLIDFNKLKDRCIKDFIKKSER